jgi:ubiquinone biosynthesis protein COQ4
MQSSRRTQSTPTPRARLDALWQSARLFQTVLLGRSKDPIEGIRVYDRLALWLGRGDARMLSRMRATEQGRRLLEERQDVLAPMTDREGLRRMPAGSLGRSLVAFLEERSIRPEELAAKVQEARADSGGFAPGASPDVAYLHDRFRDLHDLWHVATGYDNDWAGEYGVVAFSAQQVGYRSQTIATFVSSLLAAISGRPDVLRTWFAARKRAKAAPFLLAEDWPGMLSRPLNEVRRQLALDPIPEYRKLPNTAYLNTR